MLTICDYSLNELKQDLSHYEQNQESVGLRFSKKITENINI